MNLNLYEGIPSAEVFGGALVECDPNPTGILSAEAFGVAVLGLFYPLGGSVASAEAVGDLHLVQVIQPSWPVGKTDDSFGLVGLLTPTHAWVGPTGIASLESTPVISLARTGVNLWPSSARISALDTQATVLCPSRENVFCRGHGDGSVEKISFVAGQPYADGNGHPRDVAATYWGRCTTCDRLFIVMASTQGYRRFSHRVDIPLVNDTYLDESDPDTSMAAETTILGSGTTSARRHPTFFVPVIDTLIPAGARVIKGAIYLYATAIDAGMSAQGWKVARSDASKNDATWNEYKSGASWNTAGALGDDTDRDTKRKAQYAQILGGTGWMRVLSDGFMATCLQELRTEEWAVTLYVGGSGVATFKSVEAAADNPILQVWYEL